MVKEIELHGKWSKEEPVALVDDEDEIVLSGYRWQVRKVINGNGPLYYARHSRRDKDDLLMHRVITGAPLDRQVDHKNHNGLDNRKANLRVVLGRQNLANKRGPLTSEFPGVSWNKRGKWHAQICIDSRVVHLGWFHQELDAARAYEEAFTNLKEDQL